MRELQIDRQVLKQILTTGLQKKFGENEWCVGCGAGANSTKPGDLVAIFQDKGQQFLDPKILQEFVIGLKDRGGIATWCVGCGASKGSPVTDIVNPADLSDDYIEELAQQLVTAVKVG